MKKVITTANNVRFCTAIAGTWENAFDTYVVAWLTDSVLSLKYRPMHTTNYKLAQIETNELKLFPNPVTDWAVVNLPPNSSFKITDLMGTTVSNGNSFENDQVKIYLGEFRNGLYFLSTGNKTISFLKK